MVKPLSKGKTVILVNGVPASGKSTVAQQIASHFTLPLLTIDGIKEPFMAQFTNIDRGFNRKLGLAAYEVIWSIVASGPAEYPFVIDAWFGFQSRETLLHYLARAGVTQALEIWNQISADTAVARYAQRLDTRPQGHPGKEYLPELAELADNAKPMACGPVYHIEQDRGYDETELTKWIASYVAQAV
ncbi:AAA family ATPase [Superficieibacter electus]|uniref:AAA family ATPase n=1 Tax=Superficieibacter electus TaxID=2022662 RepID=A0A2P5GLV2_9ENTR|nr:AAA family ATPase [Superficieibacter electus]MDU4436897.1 AAA family ATPase [Pluralibacter gergoviae]POP43892.1 AAA family ATPase [Superficieibacter electus]POP46189.1 AAA family ATPase [Superficieibacter electus]